MNQTRRRRVPLPVFAPRCNAVPERAWNDKIKLDFRKGSIHVSNSVNLYQYLSGLKDVGHITGLKRKSGNSRIEFKLPDSVSLLGAQFVCWPANNRIVDTRNWNLKTTLEINPTRLFSHCGCRITRLRALRRGYFPQFDEERDQQIRDETLDNSNNYYTDADVRQAVNTDRQSINEHAIRACMAFVEHAVEPRVSSSGEVGWHGPRTREVQFQFNWDHWAISQLETYWEFDCLDAVSTVHAIAAQASEIVTGLEETYYALDDIGVGRPTLQRPDNAVSLTIPLGQRNTKLVIYAKSPRRVRCEVRHLKNPRTIYGRYSQIQRLTTDRLENLFKTITAVNRLSACNRANPFLHELWRRDVRPVGTVVQLTIFLGHIAEVCESTDADMVRVLSPLIAHGRLGNSGPGSYRSAVSQLVHRGVLVLQIFADAPQGAIMQLHGPMRTRWNS